MKQNVDHWVVDIETMFNCIMFCFEHHTKKDKRIFVIHTLKNDIVDLFKFLDRNIRNEEYHITFNGLGFDSQIIQWMLENRTKLEIKTTSDVVKAIYDRAQHVISTSGRGEWPKYPEWKMSIKQLDIFKMNHWDNPAKMTSLKWLECNMDWPNVMDMPIHHTESIHTMDEIKIVANYCFNDVSATKKGYQLSSEQIKIRAELTEKYGINLYSASEPRMSKELFLYFLSEKLKMDKRELKRYSTQRDIIKINQILLPYIEFKRQEFKQLFNNFNKLEVKGDELKGSFKYVVNYKGMDIDYGMGGIHGFSAPGIYQSDDTRVIKSVDVESYYPNLCIKNKFSPAHIPKQEFCDQYEWFFQERKKHKKGTPINYVLKILLNSTFGLSIDKNSFLSDPQMGCQITINGQLLLSMLLEMLCENIPNSTPIMMNTDGLEIIIPRDQEQLYNEICKEWEKKTQLVLEHDEYQKLFAYDVNNYIGVFKNGKTKSKGRFEYEVHDKYEVVGLHKNKSFLVVAKGIYEYFINGIEPEAYLESNQNIYDYCGYVRAKGKFKLKEYIVNGNEKREAEVQKTLRYYVAVDGNKIVKWKIGEKKDPKTGKKTNKLGETQIEAGEWLLRVFNKYEKKPWADYNINKKYYLKEIQKEINGLKKPAKKQILMDFPE